MVDACVVSTLPRVWTSVSIISMNVLLNKEKWLTGKVTVTAGGGDDRGRPALSVVLQSNLLLFFLMRNCGLEAEIFMGQGAVPVAYPSSYSVQSKTLQ